MHHCHNILARNLNLKIITNMKTTRYLFAILISVMLCSCSEEETILNSPPQWHLYFGTYISFVDENGEDLLLEDASSNNLFQQNIHLSTRSFDFVAKWGTPPILEEQCHQSNECYFHVFSSAKDVDHIPDELPFDQQKRILSSLIDDGKSVMMFSKCRGGVPLEAFQPIHYVEDHMLTIDGLNVSHTVTIDLTVNTIGELYFEHNYRFEPQTSTPPTYRYFLDGEETSLPITIVIPRAELANLPE